MIVKSTYFKKQFDVNKAQLIGEGNFAQVYRVFHQETQNYLAIRRVDRDLGESEDIEKEKTINEELRRVENQNILQIFDIIETTSCIWYITEYCEGGSLWDVLNTCQDNKMNQKDALECIHQVSKGVKQLHNHRITHRDLKPQNILLKTKYIPNKPIPTIKIADFGLSTKKIIMETIAGTKQYIAPEQARFHNYTNAVDVWSLGIIFDEILHGSPFYVGDNNKQVFQKIVKNPYKVRDETIRPSIQEFLMAVLKKKAYQRPIIAVICQSIQRIQDQIRKERGQKQQKLVPSFEKKNVRSNQNVVQELKPLNASSTLINISSSSATKDKQRQKQRQKEREKERQRQRQRSRSPLQSNRSQQTPVSTSHNRSHGQNQHINTSLSPTSSTHPSNLTINTNYTHSSSNPNSSNVSSSSINTNSNRYSNQPPTPTQTPTNNDDKNSNRKQERKAKTPFKRQNGRPEFFKGEEIVADISPTITTNRDRKVTLTGGKKQGEVKPIVKQTNKQPNKQLSRQLYREQPKQTKQSYPVYRQQYRQNVKQSKQKSRQQVKTSPQEDEISEAGGRDNYIQTQPQQKQQQVNTSTSQDLQKQKISVYNPNSTQAPKKRAQTPMLPKTKQPLPQIIDIKDYMQGIIKIKSQLGQTTLTIGKQRQFIINSQLSINQFPAKFEGEEILRKYRKGYQFLNFITYNTQYETKLYNGKNNLGEAKTKCEGQMNEYREKIKKCLQGQIDKYVDGYVQKTIK